MRNGIFLFVVFFSLIGVNTCETELLSTCNMAGKMMKAVIAEAGKLVLVERPVPAVKVGEVLVKVHFTAINRADTLQRKGLYPVPAGQTDIFGLEMSGVVEGKGKGRKKIRTLVVMAGVMVKVASARAGILSLGTHQGTRPAGRGGRDEAKGRDGLEPGAAGATSHEPPELADDVAAVARAKQRHRRRATWQSCG